MRFSRGSGGAGGGGFLLALLLFASTPLAHAAAWSASIDTQQGLPLLSRGGAPAIKSAYVFWGANWSWADLVTQFKVASPFSYQVTGKNATLGFDLNSTIRRDTPKQMTWSFELNAAAPRYNVIGGGLAFKFDTANFGGEMGLPTLLADKSGWTWGKTGGNRIEMRFSPTPSYLYIEPGSKNEIRALFYNGSVPAGATRASATLTLTGDMAFVPTSSERFGMDDPTKWPADILDWRTSPVDLSFLNQPEIPAGKHGFIQAAKDKLIFEDGTPARFWGTNLAAYTLYGTSPEGVKQQARRLSQLGFNLVRLHHHDSPWVSPNIFGPASATDTLSLSAASLEKLDWWIKCLKDEGIYVWLDLHAMRFLKAGDRIDHFEEIAKGKPDADLKGYNYVNSSIAQAMRDFSRAYLDHTNPHTGKRYKEEPSLIGLLVTNENDVTHHYGNSLLPDKKVPQHNALYQAAASRFATTWGLSQDATWHSWEYGPSKRFLNDLEYRFADAMIDDLRAGGAKAPIATTNSWGGMPLSSLPALSAGNVIDVHAYGGIGELDKNPLYAANFVAWLAAAQVAGKPLTVTEWNVENFPAPDRHGTPLYVAASASLQGWDAVMQYAYSQAALDSNSVPSNWHAYSDPALIATLPAAALLYRQGHVRESDSIYAFAPSADLLFKQMISPANSVALRTAVEKGKLVIALPGVRELPWLEKSVLPKGAVVISDPQQSLIPSNAQAMASDTGQLRRNWDLGIYTVNTPRTQAAMGWLGGNTITFPDVAIALTTRNASVAVQSLDGQPLSASRDLMISLGARAIPAAPNRMPYHAEPLEGRLTIRAPSGLKLYKKRADGTEQEWAFSYAKGIYAINLTPALRTYWLRLK